MKLKELKQGDRFTLTGTLTQTHKYWAEEGIEEATLLGKDTNGEFNYWAKTPAGDYEIYLEDSSDIDVIKVTTTVEAAKAESYLQRQAEWVEKNGIKPGAKLKVTRAAKSREDGWMNSWTRTMDGFVGGEVEFRRDAGPIGIACNGIAYDFPYFVLEPVPVKPPEPPYADRQAEWVKKHNIKPGSLVRFSRKWDAAEFSTPVHDSKKDVGKVLVVSEVRNDGILLKRSDGRHFPAWTVPYFVLEPIALPEGYRLMDDDEVAPEGAMFYGAHKSWLTVSESVGKHVGELKKKNTSTYWAFACKEPEYVLPEGYRLLRDDEPLRNGDLRIDGCDPKPRQWLPTDGFTITAGEFKRRYDGLKVLAIARKIESYKPYTLEDSLLGMWVLNKTSKSKYIICAMSTMGVNLPGIGFILYEVLLRDYTFTDGSPCGKKV